MRQRARPNHVSLPEAGHASDAGAMIAAGLSFFAAYVLAGGGLVAAGLLLGPSRGDPAAERLANAALAGYLVVVQALLNTAAFSAVSALSRAWRRRAAARRALASAVLGVAAQASNWVGVWALAAPIISFITVVNLGWLMFAVPGVLAGLVAVLLGRFERSA
jgi:hypothetical protein